MKYYMAKKRFGSIEYRESIIVRDQFKCFVCNINREDHKKKYGCDLTVDHIDGNGRFSENPNNSCGNLITLCKKCHGSKDGKRADYSKRRSFKGINHPITKLNLKDIENIKQQRELGKFYREIANNFKVSISCIHYVCSGKYGR